MTIKVLHINTYDTRGGAARAAYRIHRAQRSNGICSEMLVGVKDSEDPDVNRFKVPNWRRKIKWAQRLQSLQGAEKLTSRSCNIVTTGIYNCINQSQADLINLHWIGDEFIGIAEMSKIKKPIVWTLHDMWAFCGAEHYDNINSPGRYESAFSRDNRQPSDKGLLDIDGWTWKRKQKHWKDVDFHFVTPSTWMAGCLKKSSLFNESAAQVIPNCIDTDIFYPQHKKETRDAFGLPPDKLLILAGADWGIENPLKGYSLLIKALASITSEQLSRKVELVMFGSPVAPKETINGFKVNSVGRLHDDRLLSKLYNAADLFVIPSLLDNLPNTVVEAMSCETPCIGFDTAGIPDLIDHNINGLLAEPFDCEDLARQIVTILQNHEFRNRLGQNARQKVLRSYQPSAVAKQYETMYRHVLTDETSA